MNAGPFKLKPITALILSLIIPTVYAAEATDPNKPKEVDESTRMVITGSVSGTAVRKVDAAYAVTNLNDQDIKLLAPMSTADLLKAVPGVWSESSGGVSGANVFVRGFPGGGDAPFLTVQVEGSPIFPPPTLSFLENSTLFRLDETIEYMDALRGGPNPIISNGQPGLTTNFKLKDGSNVTDMVKYSTSDFDLQRIDTVFGGALPNDFYFMVGGYIKRSPGVRDAGFTAEEGQQFTLKISKDFDRGSFSVYTRQTDDHGVWYLPTPLNVKGVGNEYTQIGPFNRQATIQYGVDGTEESFDFGDGRGWVGSVSGGNINLDISDDWILVDRFNVTSGDADTFGLVPNGAPVALSTVADNGVNANGAVTGDVYAGDTMVQQIGRWVVKKDIESFTNDLAITHKTDTTKTTFGYYAANFSAKDWWALGNQAYHVVAQGGEMLTGIDCNDNQDSCGWNYDINSVGDGTTRAVYAAFEIAASDALTLDAGVRNENHQIQYTVDEGLDGQITKSIDYDESDVAWTLGANWAIDNDMGVFVRLNEGSKMPYFDDFRDNYGAFTGGDDLIKEVSQFEFGYKLAGKKYSVYATAFSNEVKGDSFVRQPGAPAEILTNQAYGVELDLGYRADNGFAIKMNSTVQKTEITDSPTNEGNEAQRQPGWQLRITSSYDLTFSNGVYGLLYGTFSAVDDRYADNENTVVLDGYKKLDLGVTINPTENVEVQLAMQNVTDEEGLTEGDPRNPSAPNGRFILPRNMTLSVSYTF